MPFNKVADLTALKTLIEGSVARYPQGEQPATLARTLNDSALETVTRRHISAEELQLAVVGAEFITLSSERRDLWNSLLAAAPIDMSKDETREQLDIVWADGTTRTNIRARRTKSGSDLEKTFGEGSRCSHREVTSALKLP